MLPCLTNFLKHSSSSYFVCACVFEHAQDTAHLWRSEDNFQDFFFFLPPCGSCRSNLALTQSARHRTCDAPASTAQVLELQACSTVAAFIPCWKSNPGLHICMLDKRSAKEAISLALNGSFLLPLLEGLSSKDRREFRRALLDVWGW